MTTTTTTVTVPMSPSQATEALRQIGSNLWAISGGRRALTLDGALRLPVSHGYHVEVRLTASDEYKVARVFIRSRKRFAKGVESARCDTVGEVAYRASCFRNVEFGEESA